jgi:hypothetical protein
VGFSEGAWHVREVLKHHARHHRIERAVREGQLDSVGFVELHVHDARTARAGDLQHAVAHIDAIHFTGGADHGRHLQGLVAGPGADIEDALARLEAEGSDDRLPTADGVRDHVDRFDQACPFILKLQLRHAFTPSAMGLRARSPVWTSWRRADHHAAVTVVRGPSL